MLQFETGIWIKDHSGKYDLCQSGMHGRVNLLPYFEKAFQFSEDDLKGLIAEINGAESRDVVVTHGATEAAFMVMYFLKARGKASAKFAIPEYEMLMKLPAFFYYSNGGEIEVFSNTNNPTGTISELSQSRGTVVADETFMQFHADLDRVKYRGEPYRINTLTKFYGGDDIRVGYIIAPGNNEAIELERLRGIFTEPVSKYNMSIAAALLSDNERIKESVRSMAEENHKILINNREKLKFYKNKEPLIGTVALVDYSEYTGLPSTYVAARLSKSGICAIPGDLFGIRGPYLRVCYTRENFSEALFALIDALERMQ